jgi:hypothetical protein
VPSRFTWVPGVFAALRPPANGCQPSGLRLIALCVCVFLAACGEEKISVYSIPKEDTSEQTPAETAGSSGEITWTVPEGWQEQPATAMRLGSFLITGANGAKADVSVSAFPGDAGGDLANINRWRGQINLGPINEAAFQSAAQKIEINGDPALFVEIDEKPDGAGRKVLGAILHRADRTWFFKMTGDDSLVASQKNAFLDFLKSVRFAEAGKPAGPLGFTPGRGQPASAAKTPKPTETPKATEPPKAASKLQYTVPAGWQEQPVGGMRQASFLVSEGERKADISVIVLGGPAGGTLANVNRWRSQLSLAPVQEADLATLGAKTEVGGNAGIVVDMASEAPLIDLKYRQRIVGAIVERGDKTWFIKMTGEDALVSKQKPAFLEFLKSVRLPNG